MNILRMAVVGWLCWAGIVYGQGREEGIIVTGEGRVSVPPDVAMISLGVTQNADTAQEVMGLVSDAVAAVLGQLEALGVAEADRQTSGFYLQPVRSKRGLSSGASAEITGYQAGNNVSVRVVDLNRLGPLMDAVIDIGANDFNGLRFSLEDDAAALAQARSLAVADAQARARQLAQAAEITLGPVVRMVENSHQGGARMESFGAARSSIGEAIATGEVDVTAQVTMVFQIGH